MELFQQQARNRRMTVLLIGAFVLVLGLVGGLLDVYFQGAEVGSRAFVPYYTFGAVGFSLASGLFSYYVGDKMVLASMRARALDPSRQEEQQLQNEVEEKALASGMPMPKLNL
jgi:Zn-dependent protease with chaperone function